MAVASYHTAGLAPAVEESSSEREPWWLVFKDQTLQELVDSALRENLSVAQTLERIKQADAFYTQATSARLPQLELDVSASQMWDADGELESRNLFGVGAFWGIDFFNRQRSNQLAREYELVAASHEVEAARLLLSAEVADTYYRALEQRLLLQLLNAQVQIDKELLGLVQKSFQAGVVTRVDVLQQQGQLADAESLLPLAELSLRILENRLDVLVGKVPDGENRTLERAGFPEHQGIPEIGVPSSLLLDRPDLRAQRALLIAADAEIAEAIAARLPLITISANSSLSLGSSSGGIVSSVLAGLVQPLIDWGARKAEVSKNESLYREQLLFFTESYLRAIEEVENAVYQIHKQQEYLTRLKSRLAILADTLDETRRRYDAGLTDYLPVLQALQDLRLVERNVVTQERILTSYYIALHRALGSAINEKQTDATQEQSAKEEL